MKFKEYAGKIAFVAGGSSGIGLACAELLAASGAEVVIFARGQAQLDRALQEIERNRVSEKQRFLAVRLDVSQRAQAENLLHQTVADFGSPDILIIVPVFPILSDSKIYPIPNSMKLYG